MRIVLLIFLIGISFTLILFTTFKFYFRRFLLVKPSLRGAHQISIPQGGGITFPLASFFHFDLFGFKLIALIPLLIVSFLDDLIDLPWKLRLGTQIFTSTLLISTFLNKIPNNFFYIIFLIAILLIFTSVSISNFMDGIDGLVASCMFLIILTISIDLNLNIYFLLGALFGFIIINWNPAKVFMGDIGSNFLGYFVVVLILENNQIDKIISGFLLMSPLIMDSGICLIKRILNEENKSEIFKPHKKHLYQKMYQAGISQKKVSLMYIFTTLYLCSIYLFFYNIGILLINSLIILIGIFLLDKRYSSITNN